ncbi:MAG: nucleoside deaminase [Alphaproteobacteria bacterium]|nr:nucleoside deaminase [Alphaproteobacteria bacterium]
MNDHTHHHSFMSIALEEAHLAAARDEVPIGAIIVDSQTGEVVARAGNRTIEYADPTAHAEILVIREACAKTGKQRIPEFDLYVTLEPCTMCAAAISFARIRTLVFGAKDPKSGGILHGAKFFEQPTCHHKKIEIIDGIMANECRQVLQDYFKSKR